MGDIYTVCRWMRNTFGRDNADVGGMRKMVAQMINSSKIHACKSKTGVLNKPEKSRNMIAAPKGYDSKERNSKRSSVIVSQLFALLIM